MAQNAAATNVSMNRERTASPSKHASSSLLQPQSADRSSEVQPHLAATNTVRFAIPPGTSLRSPLEQTLQCLAVSLQNRLSLQSKDEHTAKHLEECQRVLDTLALARDGTGNGTSPAGVSPTRPSSPPGGLGSTMASAGSLTFSSAGSARSSPVDIAEPRVLPGSPCRRPLCNGDAVRNLAAACRAPSGRLAAFLESAVLSGSTIAQGELGYLQAQGLCGKSEATRRRGLENLDQAVAAGLPSAMNHVAWCLLEGIGVDEDVEAGVAWLFRAASADYCPAMHELGQLCEDGLQAKTGTVERDLPSAFRWYKRAALLGFGPSQLNLAKLYLMSDTVLKDPNALPLSGEIASSGDVHLKALYWLNCAADGGSSEARQLLERMPNAPGRTASQ